MSEKEDIKKKIRALLISSQSGVPLFNFLKDYYDIIGEPLKFRDLGYFDLEDFLLDMPDVVDVVKAADGQTVLKHVTADSTKHIEKLVARQKTVTKKPRASNNSYKTNGYFQSDCISPSHSSYIQKRSPVSPTFANRFRPNNSKQFRLPSLPNFIKIQIQQTLRSFSEPISVHSFDAAYKARFGASLNYEKCGFCSLDAVLQSIPEMVMGILQRNGQYHYKLLKPPYNMDYRNGSPYSPQDNFISPSNTYHQPYSLKNLGFKTSIQRPVPLLQVSTSYSLMHSQPFYAAFGSPNSQSRHSYSNASTYDDKIHKDKKNYSPRRESYCSPAANLGKMNNSSECNDMFDPINPEITSNIMKILDRHPEGLYSSKLCSAYQKHHGSELDYRDMGFLSVIDLVSKLDTVHIVRPAGSGDWILYDTKKSKETAEKLANQLHSLELNKSKLTKEKEKQVRLSISKMMESFPNGLNLDCFMENYKATTGSEFQPSDVGYKSLESYILSLANNIIEISYSGNACLTIKSAKKHNSNENQQRIQQPVPKHSVNPPQSLSITSLPEDAVGPGVSYRLLDIPNNIHFVEVFVSNIENPGHFWLKFRGKAYSVALENLMDELELLYYSSDADAYHVPDEYICVGLVAAAIYPEDQNWHRVYVTKVPNVSFVEVYFVDYGNTCTVSRNSLRLLRNHFLSLPMQAIEGRLANVKPINDEWSTKARNRMLSLCFNKPLIALVTQVKDRIMSVCLTDTSDNKIDIHINDVLVAEKYCIFYPDDNDPDTDLFQNCPKPEISGISEENIFSEITKDSLDQSVSPSQKQYDITMTLQQQIEHIKTSNCKVNGKMHSETTNINPGSLATGTCEDKINKEPSRTESDNKLPPPVNKCSKSEVVVRPTSISTMPITNSICKVNMNPGNFLSNNLHTSDISKEYPISQGNNLKPFVQRIELTPEIAIHLFNFNGTACISSCELSSFFWKIDIIRTMLRRVNLGISKVIICQEDYEELFKELENINFSGLKSGDDHKDWLTLFRLEDVPLVLETFCHPSAELKAAVNKAIQEFEPDDNFWKNNSARSSLKKVSDSSTLNMVKCTSPVSIPTNKLSNQVQHLSVKNKGQLNLSKSASPPSLRSQWSSPSQEIKFKAGSLEAVPWLRHSSASGEDMKTINYNLTIFHKQRQRILNRLMKDPSDYENCVKELEDVEDKLQKLNELLIKLSPTVENRDPPGRSHSPYHQSQSNHSGSPSSSLGLSPRDTRSTSRSPSSSPVPENVPLTPKILNQMLDSQYAAMFAASGAAVASNEHFLAIGQNSYPSGHPFSNNSSQLSERPYKLSCSPTARNNSNKLSPLLLPGLYPLLREQIASTSSVGYGTGLLGVTQSANCLSTRTFNSTSPSLSPKHVPFRSPSPLTSIPASSNANSTKNGHV
ncbi:tudor domain-containing protein 5 isoform X3 [Octopus bimaculoides]|uniref:tudor domain-containing protein 5 isoform X3 n=1 Tax=Octopus bimaculoides TaxID=37653 RepID=UPI00071DF3C8|nr:tudor domain-containing protein 5 isoform X3 [Octopus bimaculoides]|eukprot:XP_014769169.1 PREDICTED: tudor domain-containing protein 5-like isoform X3 [Octopus bimaculoides]